MSQAPRVLTAVSPRTPRRPLVALALALVACGLLACGESPSRRDRPKVAVSIFPLYDIARRVAGDQLEVILVLPAGRSAHSYRATPREMARLSGTRLAVGIGLQLDTWLAQAVHTASGGEVELLELGPQLHPRPHSSFEGRFDPHVWLDPVRMQDAVEVLVAAFTRLEPTAADSFRARGDEVKRALHALDERLRAERATFTRASLVTSHSSFGYFAERYQLDVVGVVQSAPSREPTEEQLADLVAVLRETPPAAVFSEPQLDPHPAQAVARDARLPLFELDPLGGTDGLASYEALLLHNSAVLARALR